MEDIKGVIYIMTNPSFPEYVKIGYAHDVKKRLKELNRSEGLPFSFRIFATYKVSTDLTDQRVHQIIDALNPNLRAREKVNGKTRVREFFQISAEEAYQLLSCIAEINGLQGNLKRWNPNDDEIQNEKRAEEIRAKRKQTKLPQLDWMIEQGLVKLGDKIYVISKPDELATIVDDQHVKYRGETISMNAFGKKVTGWKAIQSYKEMRVVGSDRTLDDLRMQRMRELGITVTSSGDKEEAED